MATGFTLFMDILTDLVPRKNSAQRLYLPFGVSSVISDKLRDSGWVVVHGLVPELDIESEGRRLLCSHLWVEDEVHPLSEPQEPGAR